MIKSDLVWRAVSGSSCADSERFLSRSVKLAQVAIPGQARWSQFPKVLPLTSRQGWK
jgi:hypothetical protein